MSRGRNAGKDRRLKGVGAEIRAEAWAVRVGLQQNMLQTVAQAERSHGRAARCVNRRALVPTRTAGACFLFPRKRRSAFSKKKQQKEGRQ